MRLLKPISRRCLLVCIMTGSFTPKPSFCFQSPLSVQFYADVTKESCFSLKEAVSEKVNERYSFMQVCEITSPPPLRISINSHGGSLIEGLSAYDELSKIPNLHTHINGICCNITFLEWNT